MKQKIYVLGNELEATDSKAMILMKILSKKSLPFEFIVFDPTEEFPDSKDPIILLDTVINISKPTLFTSLSEWKLSPSVSVHDFDLPLSLGILKKLGKIKDIYIIGVPNRGNNSSLCKKVLRILNSI